MIAAPFRAFAKVLQSVAADTMTVPRLFGADIVGYLVGYAQLTNRVFWHASAIPRPVLELLFSFSSPEEKNNFLNSVRPNEDMGKDYIIELTPPTTEEIRNARPLATVLPQDAFTHAMLIAETLCAGKGR
jgi:hypothetical protein